MRREHQQLFVSRSEEAETKQRPALEIEWSVGKMARPFVGTDHAPSSGAVERELEMGLDDLPNAVGILLEACPKRLVSRDEGVRGRLQTSRIDVLRPESGDAVVGIRAGVQPEEHPQAALRKGRRPLGRSFSELEVIEPVVVSHAGRRLTPRP